MKWAAVPLLGLLLGGQGCTAAGRWLRRRGLDLLDCVKLSAGVGYGLTADARLTDWFAPGLGFAAHIWSAGWEDREVHGVWEEWTIVNTPRAVWEANVGDFEESRTEPGYDPSQRVARLALASVFLANERWIRVPATREVRIELYSLFNFANVPPYLRLADPRASLLRAGETASIHEKPFFDQGWIEAGVVAGFVGLRAGVNPFQAVDFVLGLFGLDPAGDDRDVLPPAPEPVLRNAAPQRRPPRRPNSRKRRTK